MYFFVQVKDSRTRRPETFRRRLQTGEISVRSPVVCRTRFRSKQCAAIILLAFCSGSLAANWQSTISKDPPGNFPEPRPLRATYRFGWSGFTAAAGDVHFTKPSGDKLQLDGTGRTIGLVRFWWKLDANYHSVANAQTLHPIESRQAENYRAKEVATHLTFTNNGVTSARTDTQVGAVATKTRQFAFPNLFDLHSAMLYVRSQPLREHSVERVVVYPGTNAYVATITVVGREKISVHAGTYDAIKLDLQLNRVGKHLELEPHRKFRRATIWVSDDSNRILLRIEAQIFVGTVFAELQSVHFDSAKS